MKWVFCQSPCRRDFKEFTSASPFFPAQYCLFIPSSFPELRERRAAIMIGHWTSWHLMMMTPHPGVIGAHSDTSSASPTSGHPGPIVRCQLRDDWEHRGIGLTGSCQERMTNIKWSAKYVLLHQLMSLLILFSLRHFAIIFIWNKYDLNRTWEFKESSLAYLLILVPI